jgi:hypothetical protein
MQRPEQPAVCHGTRDGTLRMKGHAMNTQIQTSEQLSTAAQAATDAPEWDELARCGFSAEESTALLWLRHWYQSGGSDRMQLVRDWEFLKWLVMTGTLAV